MLAGLGHYAVIAGDYEHDDIHAACARDHVFDKFLVAGYVDHADAEFILIDEVGETHVDGHATGFLFFPAVRVDVRQPFYERAFAVVNVPSGADDDISDFVSHWRIVGENSVDSS